MWVVEMWAIIVAPIVLGVGVFGYFYLKEEFYSAPFYDDYED